MADKDKSGRRNDGDPYKPNNTRGDGSYEVGRNRPPVEHQFRKGDKRPRGRRPKGRKNILTEWREELNDKISINEGGKPTKVTKSRALIKTTINRALKGSDRAVELVLRKAEESEKRDPGLQSDDLDIIAAWLSVFQRKSDSDDLDESEVPSFDADDGSKVGAGGYGGD